MSATLNSTFNAFHPLCMTPTPNGDLLLFNGLDKPQRWDGRTTATENAGIPEPSAALSASSSGSGSITGVYVVYVRYLDRDGNFGNLSPVATFTGTSDAQVDYSSIPVSSDTRVAARQIFRSTAGQSTTVYLDITISDNSTTTGTGTKTDAQLQASTALPILLSDGSINANRFTQPSDLYSVVVHHSGRMFAAVTVDYTEGHVAVTNGSATVTGVGTRFTTQMAGRYLHVVGATTPALISSVGSATSLTLSANWAGTSNTFGVFSIKAAPAYRNLVAYTPAGYPEGWPATYGITTPEDGDLITGLMPLSSFLFILKERHVYRFTHQEDPAIDGAVFRAASRGCLNQRCWVQVEETAFILDRQGVYSFDGATPTPVSGQIKDFFEPGRINWSSRKWFHAEYDPNGEVIRFFVALGDTYLPRHALCYSVREGRWWEEEWTCQIGASCLAEVAGRTRFLAGSNSTRIILLDEGTLDIPTRGGSTVQGTATSASVLSLTDSAATFTSGVVGAPLAIIAGRGKGQVREIVDWSATKLSVKTPWSIKPDTTSRYQVGGFAWRFRTGRYEYPPVDECNRRQVRLDAEPTDSEATVNLRMYLNYNRAAQVNAQAARDELEITREPGEPDVAINLSRTANTAGEATGVYRNQFDDNAEQHGPTDRFLSVELRGIAADAEVNISGLTIGGVGQ